MPGNQPAVGDILQVRFCCYTPDQICLNILHYRVQSITGASARISAMAVNLDSAMHTFYKLLMPPEASYRGVGVKNITPVETVEQTITVNDGAGTGPANMAPTQTSYVCKLPTLFAGRGHRGRVFPGFPCADYVDPDGGMSVVAQGRISNWAIALPTTMNITDTPGTMVVVMVILRRMAGGAPLPFPTFDTVQGVVDRPFWATQRRRGDFGRKNLRPF